MTAAAFTRPSGTARKRDTLWDIDEVAALHGSYASWVLGGAPHPRPTAVRGTLEKLRGDTLDLRLKLEEHPECTQLAAHVGRLEELRTALADYFDEERRSTSNSSEPPSVRPPAAM